MWRPHAGSPVNFSARFWKVPVARMEKTPFSAVTYNVPSSRLNAIPAKVLPPRIASLDATRRTFKESHRFADA